MSRARLLGHKELLTIEPIDRENTPFDTLAGEPIGNIARGEAITLPAQLETTTESSRTPGQGGARRPVVATAGFLTADVDAAGWSPANGDRVVQVADTKGGRSRAVNWYVQIPQLSGKTHYGNELVVVELVDRDPVRLGSEGIR